MKKIFARVARLHLALAAKGDARHQKLSMLASKKSRPTKDEMKKEKEKP